MTGLKIAFIKNIEGKGCIASCTCKTIQIMGDKKLRDFECESCGNKEYVYMSSYETRVIHPYIEILENSGKGFKARRTNLSVFFDDDFNILTKKNMTQVLLYDLANKKITIYKNGSDNICIDKSTTRSAMMNFLRSVDDITFKNMISSTEMKEIYDIIWNNMCRSKSWGGDKKLWRGLFKFIDEDFVYVQILNNAGFKNISRFYGSGYHHRGETLNKNGKNPKEILGLPKYLVEYIRDTPSLSLSDISTIKNAISKVDGNKFKESLGIIEDESNIVALSRSIERMMELYNDYGYKNLKKLTLYLFREIRMTQGMNDPSNGATLLRDYARMSTVLGLEYEKYPKSLKKEHDVIQMNYKVQESDIKKKEFEHAVLAESYKELEYKKKLFSIVAPSHIDDLAKEGKELSHCISSYLKDVVDKKCKIFFLRDTEDMTTPLVSIEVRGHNVRQARGYGNRTLRETEKIFVAEWAKEKELELNYYY